MRGSTREPGPTDACSGLSSSTYRRARIILPLVASSFVYRKAQSNESLPSFVLSGRAGPAPPRSGPPPGPRAPFAGGGTLDFAGAALPFRRILQQLTAHSTRICTLTVQPQPTIVGGVNRGESTVLRDRRNGSERRSNGERRSDGDRRRTQVESPSDEVIGDERTIPEEHWDRRSGIDRRGHPFYQPVEHHEP